MQKKLLLVAMLTIYSSFYAMDKFAIGTAMVGASAYLGLRCKTEMRFACSDEAEQIQSIQIQVAKAKRNNALNVLGGALNTFKNVMIGEPFEYSLSDEERERRYYLDRILIFKNRWGKTILFGSSAIILGLMGSGYINAGLDQSSLACGILGAGLIASSIATALQTVHAQKKMERAHCQEMRDSLLLRRNLFAAAAAGSGTLGIVYLLSALKN